MRAVDDEAKTAYNPGAELRDNKKKGFLAPAPSPTAAAGARRAAEYLANPRFEVLSAAITLLSCAAYAFNTLNDLPDAVATALPILERAASAFFLAEYLARFYSRGKANYFFPLPVVFVSRSFLGCFYNLLGEKEPTWCKVFQAAPPTPPLRN